MNNTRVILIFVSLIFFVALFFFTNSNNNNNHEKKETTTTQPPEEEKEETTTAAVLPTTSSRKSALNNDDRQYFLPALKDFKNTATTNEENSYCSVSKFSGKDCRGWFKKLSSKYFRIHHLHEHSFSIERKVVRLFGPSLAQLFCTHMMKKMEVGKKSESKSKIYNHKALIVDVGVNDAEDIPYWFEKFGYFDESSFIGSNAKVPVCQELFSKRNHHQDEKEKTTITIKIDFRLFEPQSMYKKQITEVLKKELNRRQRPSLSSSSSSSDSLMKFVSIHGAFDAVAVGSDELHGTTALFYGQGEQASLGSTGKHAQKSVPVHVPVGSLSKMLRTKEFRKFNKSVIEGNGIENKEDHGNNNDKHDDEEEEENNSPILFMKVDCEGADHTIIVDSEILFSSHRVHLLVFELHKNERGFPKKFVHSTEMLTKHGYEVYLLGRCYNNNHNNLKGLMLLKMDTKASSQWTPQLEAAIAISPQLLQILKSSAKGNNNIAEYLGQGAGGIFNGGGKQKCGEIGWEFVADF
jgi:hypothetical protein